VQACATTWQCHQQPAPVRRHISDATSTTAARDRTVVTCVAAPARAACGVPRTDANTNTSRARNAACAVTRPARPIFEQRQPRGSRMFPEPHLAISVGVVRDPNCPPDGALMPRAHIQQMATPHASTHGSRHRSHRCVTHAARPDGRCSGPCSSPRLNSVPRGTVRLVPQCAAHRPSHGH